MFTPLLAACGAFSTKRRIIVRPAARAAIHAAAFLALEDFLRFVSSFFVILVGICVLSHL